MVVHCPENSQEDYCDCDGDCIMEPGFCSCTEAQACCEGKTAVLADTLRTFQKIEEDGRTFWDFAVTFLKGLFD